MSANDSNPDIVSVFAQTTKRYGSTTALDGVTLEIPRGAIVGLVGRNGCGKTTLLHHITGMVLPTSGKCTTFGVPTDKLSARDLSRIGVVHQHAKHLGWMKASRLIRYVSTFYETWDRAYEADLIARLELGKDATVSSMSPGNVQKLSLLLALCYRPELLLLDEPLSDLDPTARKEVLALLLEYFSSREVTMIVSSHLLHDIEPLVTRLVCLARGRVTANDELDALKEAYEEWTVTLA